MPEVASFRLTLQGGLADRHELEGYDGYTALAGAAWTLSLAANYIETKKISRRGDFVGRHAVIAEPIQRGSLIADFKVLLQGKPAATFEIPDASSVSLLYGLVRKVISRNIGLSSEPLNAETEILLEAHSGDVEALVVATEPSLRRAHDAIGNTAHSVSWFGGFSTMATLTPESKAYMKQTIPDNNVMTKDVSVSGFLGNSGRGLIFDFDLGRTISVSMSKETLIVVGTVFSYGLDQYLNKTGNLIRISFTRMLATDGRPKHYIILNAQPTKMLTQSRPA